jgi:hypothetical protein
VALIEPRAPCFCRASAIALMLACSLLTTPTGPMLSLPEKKKAAAVIG